MIWSGRLRRVKKIKILICIGTRPEIIKMGPLYNELTRNPEFFDVFVYHSGQHLELSNDALTAFPMVINFQGKAMQAGQLITETYSRILAESGEVISKVSPDVVLVQGDTITAFASGISAFLCKTKVGHVEAGLRSSSLESPWPEELNRVLLDIFANYLFTPTLQSTEQLLSKNPPGTVVYTGNTGIDAVLQIAENVGFIKPRNRTRSSTNPPVILVTQHRRENIGKPLSQVIAAINRLAERGYEIYFPIHANPAVKKAVERDLISRENVHLIPALGYTEMVRLLAKVDLIISDSGGLQEEGPALGIPVLVTRESTERPEGIISGSSILVGVDSNNIEDIAVELLSFSEKYDLMASAFCPYGNGSAAKIIADFLKEELLFSKVSHE